MKDQKIESTPKTSTVVDQNKIIRVPPDKGKADYKGPDKPMSRDVKK